MGTVYDQNVCIAGLTTWHKIIHLKDKTIGLLIARADLKVHCFTTLLLFSCRNTKHCGNSLQIIFCRHCRLNQDYSKGAQLVLFHVQVKCVIVIVQLHVCLLRFCVCACPYTCDLCEGGCIQSQYTYSPIFITHHKMRLVALQRITSYGVL